MPEEKETIDIPGLAPVEKEIFDDPTEEVVETVEEPTEVVTEQPKTEEVVTEQPQNQNKDDVQPEILKETPKTEPQKVFAGKFKTEDDLRGAFINLGGNPNRYDSVEKLEEAYEIRQREFTRIRQEEAERRRINENIERSKQDSTPNTLGNPQNLEVLLDKVNWDNVQNGRDLGRELLGLISQIVPKNESNLPSEEELVTKIMPIMKEREERANELRELESDIPRLRQVPGQDNQFRDAFARHVMAEKQSGSYISLKKSMESFLNWGREIVKEADRQKESFQNDKIGATQGQETGAGMPGGVNEIDDIISAHKSRKEMLGEL